VADEHESAVAAWVNDPSSQREVAILQKRFPSWRESDCYVFALLVEILSGMDFYGELGMDDDSDATGWKP
jgi:hypothetical protein